MATMLDRQQLAAAAQLGGCVIMGLVRAVCIIPVYYCCEVGGGAGWGTLQFLFSLVPTEGSTARRPTTDSWAQVRQRNNTNFNKHCLRHIQVSSLIETN